MLIGFYFLQQKLDQDYERRLEIQAGNLFVLLRKSLPLSPPLRRSFLQSQGYSIAEPHPDLIKTLKKTFNYIPKSYPEEIKDSLKEGRIQILKDENHLYIYLTKAMPPLLIIKTDAAKRALWPEILFSILVLTLLLLYWLIIKTLFPLKTLIHSINSYANAGSYLPIKSTKKDEISLVSQALDSAMQKNQALIEARRLFLRNIMHELKTPITVGKLSIPFLKNGEEKSILERAFVRMEHLISELVRVEQITSGALAPNFQTCDPKVLIDKAKNLLFINDESINATYDGKTIYTDCDVFVTVFKNLIDNAMKYSTDKKVTIIQKGDSICFYNQGESWPSGCTLDSFSEPFFHQYENTNSFGLGLYIVKSIITAHNFSFFYRYEQGEHCFEIVCQNSLLALY
jgi:two-component system, OmpR family, sensor kinase